MRRLWLLKVWFLISGVSVILAVILVKWDESTVPADVQANPGPLLHLGDVVIALVALVMVVIIAPLIALIVRTRPEES